MCVGFMCSCIFVWIIFWKPLHSTIYTHVQYVMPSKGYAHNHIMYAYIQITTLVFAHGEMRLEMRSAQNSGAHQSQTELGGTWVAPWVADVFSGSSLERAFVFGCARASKHAPTSCVTCRSHNHRAASRCSRDADCIRRLIW